MLPKSLVSSYQQYKADTDAIASWLATTARKLGYSDFLSAKPVQAKSQRLKGNARKAAKQNQQAGDSTQPAPPNKPSYIIAIKDFTTLADLIASWDKPPVKVPFSLASILNRAIAVRKVFSSKLEKYVYPDDKDAKASKDSHEYFVGILEYVRDTLRPRMPADAENRLETEPRPQNINEVTNLFASLQVEELSEEFLNAPDVVLPKKSEAPDATYQAEPVADVMEDFMALRLLLQDISKLRTEVSKSWEGYKRGMFDLVAASIATNTAIDLARSMEEQLSDIFKRYDGSGEMLIKLYVVQCLSADEDPNHREHPDDVLNVNMYDIAEALFIPGYMLVEGFCEVIEPRSIPEYKPGFYGNYNPNADRSKMSTREKLAEDQILLMRILPEFALIFHGTDCPAAEDEFMRGLRGVFQTKKVPIWVAFAAHVFLDIHHILRDDVGRGYEDLLRNGEQIAKVINTTLDFHENLRVDSWPPSNDMALRDLLKRVELGVTRDIFGETAQRLKRQHLNEPFFLLKQHPLFAGLWKYQLLALFQYYGVSFANAWGSIMYTGHLYNAVYVEKFLGGKIWKDMEVVFMNQGFDVFFTGARRPRTAEDYFKCFSLSMGYSASNFAQNSRRNVRPAASKRGPQGLQELAPVSQTFKDRFCHKSGQVDLGQENVDKILANSTWEEELEWSSDDGEKPEGVVSLARKPTAKGKAIQKPGKHARTILRKPEKLIESLRNVVQAEMLELSFDYFGLHQVCWRILRAVKIACSERLTKYFGPSYLENENQLPFLVGYIFMVATSSKRVAGILAPKKGDIITSALLEQAGEVLEAWFEKGMGSLVTDTMKTRFGVAVEFEVEREGQTVRV